MDRTHNLMMNPLNQRSRLTNLCGLFKIPRTTTIILLASMAILLSPQTAKAADADSQAPTQLKIHDAQSQIKAIKTDIKKMKSLLKELAKKRSKSTRQLESLDRDISDLHKALESEKVALLENQTQLQQLIEEGEALEIKKNDAKLALNIQIRSRHKSPTGTSQIKLLFQEENPREIDRQLNYHSYVLQSQNEHITKFNALIMEIDTNQQQVELAQENLEQRKVALEQQIAGLNATLQKRKSLLSDIKKREKKSNRRLAGLNSEQKELGAVLELLKLQAAREALKSTNFKANKGRLSWPVIVDRNASKSFQREKKGITIPTAPLSPVKAIFDGTIVFADWLRGYGWLIIVQHQDEYLSLYAHNASLEKQVGNIVKGGDLIAYSGNSGQTNDRDFFKAFSGGDKEHKGTAQLYFELRKDGKAIDPATWLAKK